MNKNDLFLSPVYDGGVTKSYGVVDKNGKHLGIDFGYVDTMNAPVLAMQNGQIVAVYYDDNLGWCSMIRHDYGKTHRYTCAIHLLNTDTKPLAKFGTIVKQGDIIGYRGNTGITSNGIHLHQYVGKETTVNLDMSYNVRKANWQLFLNMCDYDWYKFMRKDSKRFEYHGEMFKTMSELNPEIDYQQLYEEQSKRLEEYKNVFSKILDILKGIE